MSFFAVLFALLLEQVKPLPRSNVIHDALTGWMRWTARNFDAGRDSHAWVVWCVTALAPALLAWAVFIALDRVNGLLGLAFDVARAVPDARLSPVQPLLHRHSRARSTAATKPWRGNCSANGAISMRASCRVPNSCAT